MTVVGVDINAEAIAAASAAASTTELTATTVRFECGDIGVHVVADIPSRGFDLVLLQLVISLVGGPAARTAVLSNALHAVRPGGRVMISASGASDDINPEYAALYKNDAPVTGEFRTYFSRSSAGEILYQTHHFEYDPSFPEWFDRLFP